MFRLTSQGYFPEGVVCLMASAMKVVYCSSETCRASGNSQRGIEVWFQRGPKPKHYARCPYCRALLVLEFNAGNIWFVRPESRLAS